MEERYRLIYTPEERIPIGEAVVLPNGCRGICFKRKKKYEVVTMDTLYEILLKNTL